jgi:hypothetical protein
MGGIFISYRREDSGPYAGRLRDTLSRDFGAEQVFRDIDRINPGERFPRAIENAVGSCSALLALIGPTWLVVRDEAARRRLDNPDDYVRHEIATALQRPDVLVIPVLVGSTSMPAAADLPEPLAALAECNAVRITDESWDDQVARLTRALEKVVQRPVAQSTPQVAAPEAAVSAAYLSRPPAAGALPRTPQREHAVERLVESVYLQWTEEAKIRGLFDPEPMPVHWTLTEHNVSDQSRHISPGPLIFDGSSDRIDELTEQFQRLSRRRLVILGGPGSGKTTLAVQLLLRLLEVRTAADPVPVLLTANGWDTTAHPRLQDWLALRLYEDYPALRAIDRAMPRELVENGMVLPVIDGLDELDPAYRPALLRALNDSLGATDPLVLTCRTDEYVDAVDTADVLTAAAVIEARPLTAGDAADYLDSCLPPRQRPGWDPILDALRRNDDTPVADQCSTPLGLWLLRSVYIENKGDPTPLIDPAHYPDAEAIKAHLFDELIPALITKRRPVRDGSDPLRPRRGWEPDATRRWLAYLAVQLRGQRDLRWWHLPSAVPAITTLMVLVGVLVPGLVLGLAFGLGFGLVWLGLAVGLGFGLVFGLVVGPEVRRMPEPGYANWRLRDRGRALARHLAVGLGAGLWRGVGVGLCVAVLQRRLGELTGLSERMTSKLLGGVVVVGLVVGLGAGLARWLRSPESNDRSRTPTSTYRGSRNLTTLSVLVVVMVGILVCGLLGQLTHGEAVIAKSMAMGLGFGLVSGLLVGPVQEPAWLGFVVVSRWLAFRSKLPWKMMGFLDDAHRLGLLRTAGSVYQFRHAELQDYLAKPGETAVAAPAMTTPPGWYPNPQFAGTLRYWDGGQWTSHTSRLGAAAQSHLGSVQAEQVAIFGARQDVEEAQPAMDTSSGQGETPSAERL